MTTPPPDARASTGAPDEVPVNRLIAGRYRIQERLAKGGMATVYKAVDTTLNRVVAIKLLKHTNSADDPGKLTERFKLEAEALAKLNHRHIVTIFDYGDTEEGGYFLAMEFVDGPSLSGLIRNERLAPERAVRIIMQVCKALRYAHKRGIVHRDLKPGNILVAREEDEEIAKLVDFGLVKLTEEDALTQHGLILGTVHCMAPEQIRGGKIDPRTDIYAIGVVLFRLIAGQYPFNSKQTAEILAAHLHAPVPSFSKIDPNLVLPPGLEDIIRTCLQKNPAQRYQSASELVKELAECLSVPPEHFVSVSILTSALEPQEPRPASNGRNVLLGVLLGGGALALLAGGAGLAVAWSQGAFQVQDSSQASLPGPNVVVEEPEEAPEPEPEVLPEPEPAPEPEPEPEPAVVPEPAPAPRPVTPAPRPVTPAPRPAPAPKPEPQPKAEEEDNAVAVAEVPPVPEPQAAVLLQGVDVVKEADRVVITLNMSNGNVRPLHFSSEGSSDSYAKQYRFQFKGGASGLGASTVPVGHELVENVSVLERDGTLLVLVNSKTTPQMNGELDAPRYRVIVWR